MTHTPFVTTGRQRKYQFPNGYGASVISDGYGSENGHYELAVLKDGHLTYDTPITDNVLGWLTEQEVDDLLDKIAALNPEQVDAAMRAKRIDTLRAEIAEREAELASLEVTHTTQSANGAPVIHARSKRIHDLSAKARADLLSTRAAAYDAGTRGDLESDREERFAAEVTAALADLVALALGVEDES